MNVNILSVYLYVCMCMYLIYYLCKFYECCRDTHTESLCVRCQISVFIESQCKVHVPMNVDDLFPHSRKNLYRSNHFFGLPPVLITFHSVSFLSKKVWFLFFFVGHLRLGFKINAGTGSEYFVLYAFSPKNKIEFIFVCCL